MPANSRCVFGWHGCRLGRLAREIQDEAGGPMKPVAFALVFFFLPVAAGAQDQSSRQQRPSGQKMVWLGVGSLVGGAALAAFGAMSRKETMARYTGTAANSNCVSSGSGPVSSTVCAVAAATASAVPVGNTVTAGAGPQVPSNPPGGGDSSTPLSPPANTGVTPTLSAHSSGEVRAYFEAIQRLLIAARSTAVPRR